MVVFVLATSAFGYQNDRYWATERAEMVELAVKKAGVKDPRVLESVAATPRHEFVPQNMLSRAYLDAGVPIGFKQTISSPFIVAYMTETLDPQPTDKVLEIGTGSGYQAAILSPLVAEVYSIEIVKPLGIRAAKVLKKLKYKNVTTKIGDGYLGWEEHAPFDKIIVTCSPEDIPKPLVDQLKEGGMIVVPIGERHQQTLYQLVKKDGKMIPKALRPTLFVAMTGTAEDNRQVKPDPTNPVLINGTFEDGLDENGFVKGWYYQRQLVVVTTGNIPQGQAYVQFENKVPGQHAHLMQAVAIDGKKVPVVNFSAQVATANVIQGLHPRDIADVVLTFYDEGQKDVSTTFLGPFVGTVDWQEVSKKVRVPLSAKMAIVRIGLFGSTGVAKFDDVQLSTEKKE
ncbi:protein-L-isoaspartate(D-aspartate) O-methyltransferase [bacterium]|nr:protein-L-isoaspartate(D-aspartate) O-methyltransferase [bacterium]